MALFLLAAQPALASTAPGSLTQLASPDNCIGTGVTECFTGIGLALTVDVAVSPDGRNVYVPSSQAIAEFARQADGSLVQLPGPNSCVPKTTGFSLGSCGPAATGMSTPQTIAISPDGKNVYVASDPSHGVGTIAEFARNADGSLTQLPGDSGCIAENAPRAGMSDCPNQTGYGLLFPTALAVSPDGNNVYVADQLGMAVTDLTRAPDGALSEPDGAGDCLSETGSGGECTSSATGLSDVQSVTVSPDGGNVYVGSGVPDDTGDIAEFTRGANGSLAQLASPENCIGTGVSECAAGTGVTDVFGVTVSPDGRNLYSSSAAASQPIAEFARGAEGALTQLPAPNDCIEEVGGTAGCGTDGHGLGDGGELEVSPDGADVYTTGDDAVGEFARNPDGSLTQLAGQDDCIQEHGLSDCGTPGTGLTGVFALAISPDGDSVYVAGSNQVASFRARLCSTRSPSRCPRVEACPTDPARSRAR